MDRRDSERKVRRRANIHRAGACGDIRFYFVQVKFDELRDEAERLYFKTLPTTFNLSDEEVDKIKDAAHRILAESEEFQRFLGDLK
ncbi:MAG TPA: hypothetical protein VEI46_06545 [Thermodesulfovibrionales bacterium]|nr:hypothetical protein [Thermodesulfovibrionales bacterium]